VRSTRIGSVEPAWWTGRTIGRSLPIEEVSPGEWRREWFPIWPATLLDMLLDTWAAASGHAAFVTSAVAEITGAPAHTFFDWTTDHAGEFRA
jgi:hypothetical protein